MALHETTGHQLEIGDRVRMNVAFIGTEDLDGIEITADGTNYWRYMNEHPDEIYTVEEYDYSNEDEVGYILSGAMAGNNWYANELIHIPEPKTRYEAIMAMSDRELAEFLVNRFGDRRDEMLKDKCMRWLDGPPEDEMKTSPLRLEQTVE